MQRGFPTPAGSGHLPPLVAVSVRSSTTAPGRALPGVRGCGGGTARCAATSPGARLGNPQHRAAHLPLLSASTSYLMGHGGLGAWEELDGAIAHRIPVRGLVARQLPGSWAGSWGAAVKHTARSGSLWGRFWGDGDSRPSVFGHRDEAQSRRETPINATSITNTNVDKCRRIFGGEPCWLLQGGGKERWELMVPAQKMGRLWKSAWFEQPGPHEMGRCPDGGGWVHPPVGLRHTDFLKSSCSLFLPR